MCFNMAQELVWEYQVKTKKKTTEKKQQLLNLINTYKKENDIYIKLDANMVQKERGKTIHVKLIKHV